MNKNEMIADRLRGIADKGFVCTDISRTLRQAADSLENLQNENKALRQICEKQSEMNGKIADMALELDTVKAERDSLQTRLEKSNQALDAKTKRCIVIRRMISLEQESKKGKTERLVHMAFMYRCPCGARRLLWIEKGLEEACNTSLKEKSGLPHKPTPFCIRCPECGQFMNHVFTPFMLEKFEPAKRGDNLFINVEGHECGKPVFNWQGE